VYEEDQRVGLNCITALCLLLQCWPQSHDLSHLTYDPGAVPLCFISDKLADLLATESQVPSSQNRRRK